MRAEREPPLKSLEECESAVRSSEQQTATYLSVVTMRKRVTVDLCLVYNSGLSQVFPSHSTDIQSSRLNPQTLGPSLSSSSDCNPSAGHIGSTFKTPPEPVSSSSLPTVYPLTPTRSLCSLLPTPLCSTLSLGHSSHSSGFPGQWSLFSDSQLCFSCQVCSVQQPE